jgi:hypothetical protein
MWRRVGLVRVDGPEERVAFILWAERIIELGTALAVTSKLNHIGSRFAVC